MKKIPLIFIVVACCFSCISQTSHKFSVIKRHILRDGMSIEIKLGFWDDGFSTKKPDFIIKNKEQMHELAEILGNSENSYGDMKECGYDGSFIVNYSDKSKSAEIFFSYSCGQFECDSGIVQHIGYLNKQERKKLENLIQNLQS